MELTNEEVFYLVARPEKSGEGDDDFKKPNGITGTPDGKNLWFSDIRAKQTWRYDIQPDGSLTNKTFHLRARLRRHDD